MRAARRAGSAQAASATSASRTATASITRGSPARTPKSWLSRLGRSASAPAAPDDEPDPEQQQPFAHHEIEDAARAAAERDPHRDLARALRDQVGEDAVEADGREQQRHHAEPERELGGRASVEQRPLHELVHRPHVEERQLAVERRDRRAQRRRERGVARPRLHGEGHEPRAVLRDRVVAGAHGALALGDVVQLDVGDYADDGQEDGLFGHGQQPVEVGREVQPPADRVLAGPEARGELAVHDHHAQRAVPVLLLEEAAGHERSAHRLEVAGRDLHLRGRDRPTRPASSGSPRR